MTPTLALYVLGIIPMWLFLDEQPRHYRTHQLLLLALIWPLTSLFVLLCGLLDAFIAGDDFDGGKGL